MKSWIKRFAYFLFSRQLIRKGKPGAIYLTYDDGPHLENTPEILAALSAHNAKATFFMIGKNMESHPELVRSVLDQGHTIGYHSYKHDSLKKLSLREIEKDLSYARVLSKKFDYPIKLYRPPFGDLSFLSFIWLLLRGWKIIMWSRDCRDSFEGLEKVTENITAANISDSDIILLHDDYESAADLINNALSSYMKSNLACKRLE